MTEDGLHAHITDNQDIYMEALAGAASAVTALEGVTLFELTDTNQISSVLDCRPFSANQALTFSLCKAVLETFPSAAIGQPGTVVSEVDMESDAVKEIERRLMAYHVPIAWELQGAEEPSEHFTGAWSDNGLMLLLWTAPDCPDGEVVQSVSVLTGIADKLGIKTRTTIVEPDGDDDEMQGEGKSTTFRKVRRIFTDAGFLPFLGVMNSTDGSTACMLQRPVGGMQLSQ